MSEAHELRPGARRCALALHALHPSDQEWMLRRLDVGMVPEIRRLLDELAELGMPRDNAILRHLLANGEASQRVDAERWARTLDREPVALAALAVLELLEEERNTVLYAMGEHRQRPVRQRMSEQQASATSAPKLRRAIHTHLSQQVALLEPAGKLPPWLRFCRRFRRTGA